MPPNASRTFVHQPPAQTAPALIPEASYAPRDTYNQNQAAPDDGNERGVEQTHSHDPVEVGECTARMLSTFRVPKDARKLARFRFRKLPLACDAKL